MNRIAALGAVACLVLTGCTTAEQGKPIAASTATNEAPTSRTATTKTPTTKKATSREYVPTEENQDPTKKIDGVVAFDYKPGLHVTPTQRVAYDKSPPFGGAHDQAWAACTGVVYPEAVRTESIVHSLEHGAVWISYAPGLGKDEVEALAKRVDGKPYLLMSPYPGQDKPVSVQSWGRQLKVDSAGDERVDQFISATLRNKYLTPEPGASCDVLGPPHFDQDDPPPFDPTPPGPDAVPVTGG